MKGTAGWLFVVALLVLVVGCGGGGGGGGGTSTTSGDGSTGGTLHSFQATAYQGSGPMLNLRNLLVGESVQLKITGRDSKNNLVQVSVSGWTTDAPAGVATLSSSGLLTGVGASTLTSYTVTVTYNGIIYSANLAVSNPQDILTGLVRNSTNAVEDAVVDFYDSTGKVVGAAYTARDGTFRASLPSSAVRFTLDTSLADPGDVSYYPQFSYQPASTILEYLEGPSCLAPLGVTLSSGSAQALPHPIIPAERVLGPPPPPTGCLG